MRSRLIRVAGISVLVAVLAATGLFVWRRSVLQRHQAEAGQVIDGMLETKDFVSARALLRSIGDEGKRTELEHRIRGKELAHGLEVRDPDLLQAALGGDGATWLDARERERAALILARHALQAKEPGNYEKLVSAWKDAGAMPNQWYLLEEDRLIGEGHRDEAMQWLGGRKLEGSDDAYRLARLALLQAKEPASAWRAIEEGLKADPRNGDLLAFRGQFLELLGKPEEARLSYVAAVLAEPGNPLHHEALANFYRRMGRLGEAVETWRDAADKTGLGVYGFKAWFWEKVSGERPVRKPAECRQLGWHEVMDAIGRVPAGDFSSVELEGALARLPGKQKRPEGAWLAFLQTLKSGNGAKMTDAVEKGVGPEARALWPELAERLAACVMASQGKDPRLAVVSAEKIRPTGAEHEFAGKFRAWMAHASSDAEDKAFEGLLARPDSAIGALLASGWPGAALDLAGAGAFAPAPAPPEWLVFGYAKALQQRDGAAVARSWLERIPARGEASELLLGELLLADHQQEAGLQVLTRIAGGGGPHAGRARWTLALQALEKGDAPAVRKAVESDPELASGARGGELLARAALLEDKRAEAEAIYRRISGESADAMIYLAKEAFSARRYDEAESLTRQLVDRFPEEPGFRQNLRKIQEARGKGAP
ncbi:hypothetical protein [Luteolibacter sp. LG18]|uniref:hypothetical protein n=1 Tax=Luteolibacter sp. LG18 TaxID=2819286 RepID=UPI002B2EDEA4|nr:hypothetical protein llg_42830 [Luteolibacter sp. LG18]